MTKGTPLSRRPPDETDYFIMETELECARMRNRALGELTEVDTGFGNWEGG